jgi:Tol biopolymer transport system component
MRRRATPATRRLTALLPLACLVVTFAVSLGVPAGAMAADPDRAVRMVSSGYYAGAQFEASANDGATIFFTTVDSISPDDVDSGLDVYRDAAGVITLMSPSGPDDGAHSLFAGASAGGQAVVFQAFGAAVAEDTDPGSDLYVYVVGDDGPSLVTAGTGTGTFRAVSDDGSRVLFESTSSFAAADTDTVLDLYLWDSGTIRLVSGATPAGPTASAPATIVGVADDVQIVLFGSPSKLVGTAPVSGATYEWRTDGSLTVRVADPDIGGPHLSPDGSALAFWSDLGLVADDTNGTGDAYLEDGSLHLLTDGTTVDQTADAAALLVDGGTWAVVETSEALDPADTDGHVDLYLWTESTNTYEQITPGNGAFDAWFEGGSPVQVIVFRTAEALVAGDVDGAVDLYSVHSGVGIPVLVSSGTVNDLPVFDAASPQGDRILFSSGAALDPADVDNARDDVFERRNGTLTSLAGSGSTRDVQFNSASVDASLVAFSTDSSLVPADTVAFSGDVYLTEGSMPSPFVGQVLPLITPSQEATVTFSMPEAVRFECRLDGDDWSDCASPLHLIDLAEGEHTIEVRGWDHAGFADPTPPSQTWVVDLTGPSGSVSINEGAAKAGRWIVNVGIPATDAHGVLAVRLSSSPATTNHCTGGCATLDEAYEIVDPGPNGVIPFDLSFVDFGGTATEGLRTVYAQWQDGVGNWSPVTSDTIVIDRSVDVATSVIVRSLTNPVVSGGSSYLEATVTAADGTPINTGTIQFSGGGVASIQYPVSNGKVNHWQEHWTAGTHVVTATYSGATDLAGSAGTVTQYAGTDDVAPAVTAPVARVFVGAIATSPTAPIRVAWTGADPVPGFGIARYELRQSTDGAASVLVASSLTSPAATRSVSSGHTVRFAVRSIDRAGNASAWTWGPTLRVGIVSEANAAITYRGSWGRSQSSSFYGGAARASSSAGATASYRFTGRSVGWLTTMAATRGRATILIDGAVVQTVDLKATATKTRVLAYVKTWSASGIHTITIRVAGTAGRPRIDVDGFVTLR